ncbi:MAG: hypothetical protein R6U44_10445 [Archaeoglobaceae archaeon]
MVAGERHEVKVDDCNHQHSVEEEIASIELGMMELESRTEAAVNIPKRFYW